MRMNTEEKQALVFNLSRQASLMEQNAADLDKLCCAEMTASAGAMKAQALQVKGIARYIDETL